MVRLHLNGGPVYGSGVVFIVGVAHQSADKDKRMKIFFLVLIWIRSSSGLIYSTIPDSDFFLPD